jgi:hypothetical protein
MPVRAFCEWGMSGVQALHPLVGVLVIVDVLSFTTCVDVAVSRGATVYPFPFDDERGAVAAAELVGANWSMPGFPGMSIWRWNGGRATARRRWWMARMWRRKDS